MHRGDRISREKKAPAVCSSVLGGSLQERGGAAGGRAGRGKGRRAGGAGGRGGAGCRGSGAGPGRGGDARAAARTQAMLGDDVLCGRRRKGSQLWQNQPELYRLKYVSPLWRATSCFKRYDPIGLSGNVPINHRTQDPTRYLTRR
jgi:hypothetical protein